MIPSFGFGVGDFVAVASLVWKISQALSDVSEDSKLYRELQLELSAFQGVFIQFQQAIVDGVVLPQDQVTRVKTILAQIERQTKNFNNHIEKFKDLAKSTEKDRAKKFVVFKKRVSWSLYGKKPIQQFREALRGYTAILTLTMHTLNSRAMQGLQHEMHNGAKQLKLHIDNTFQEPWDQKPIRFQDAIGRRYPVPLEICGTFEGFSDFLQHAFKNDPILKAIQQQSIWLFSPVPTESKTWILITTEDWESGLYPGMQLSMSIFDGRRAGQRLISDTLSDSPHETEVRLQTPLPLWASASFPEDARFRLRAPKQKTLLCQHEENSEPRDIEETKRSNPQALSVSYPCPNEIGCGKSFGRQEEFIEHLKPEIFDPESLESFPRPILQPGEFGPSCLRCGSWSEKPTQKAFEEAIKLQKSLTSSSHGLASCIAEMAIRGDLETRRFCGYCRGRWESSWDFPGEISPLHAAASNGLTKVVEMILRNGADINLQSFINSTPLHAAAYTGKESVVKLLLDKGAIVNARDKYNCTAIYLALKERHKNIVELLVSHGADIDGEALDIAMCYGQEDREDMVSLLLSPGANMNVRSEGYDDLLRLAASSGYIAIVQILLDRGANVNSQYEKQSTALWAAPLPTSHRLEAFLLLSDRGGSCETALMSASSSGHLEVVQLLIDKGAD
ncbi:hypothetical protein PENVUL_c010G06890, partial [Penicillium vulpinum]